jgi:hypothetical protein
VNRRKARIPPGGMRQALHCLALLLLPGLVPESPRARARSHTGARAPGDWAVLIPAPYLTAVGAPGLRFLEAEVAFEPAARPVAVGPPVPGLNAAETAVAVANAAAVRVPAVGGGPMSDDAKRGKVDAPQGAFPPSVSPKSVPPAILPDDTRPRVRAEDFLPFFQVPGTVPPSSATYTQSPK